jgi:hypothetical protein
VALLGASYWLLGTRISRATSNKQQATGNRQLILNEFDKKLNRDK